MTARIEVYDEKDRDEVICWTMTEHVPRKGDRIWLNAMDKGRQVEVLEVEYWFDHGKAESSTQVALTVRDVK